MKASQLLVASVCGSVAEQIESMSWVDSFWQIASPGAAGFSPSECTQTGEATATLYWKDGSMEAIPHVAIEFVLEGTKHEFSWEPEAEWSLTPESLLLGVDGKFTKIDVQDMEVFDVHGLNLEAMLTEKQRIEENGIYDAISNNCAHVALRILAAGLGCEKPRTVPFLPPNAMKSIFVALYPVAEAKVSVRRELQRNGNRRQNCYNPGTNRPRPNANGNGQQRQIFLCLEEAETLCENPFNRRPRESVDDCETRLACNHPNICAVWKRNHCSNAGGFNEAVADSGNSNSMSTWTLVGIISGCVILIGAFGGAYFYYRNLKMAEEIAEPEHMARSPSMRTSFDLVGLQSMKTTMSVHDLNEDDDVDNEPAHEVEGEPTTI